MDSKTKEEIQELVGQVEMALYDAFKAGKMTALEYKKADSPRADLYVTLDCIEGMKSERIHALEELRREVALTAPMNVLKAIDEAVADAYAIEIGRLV